MKEEKINEFFSKQPKKNLTMGAEVEMYLYDCENKDLLRKEALIQLILDKHLPIEVTRDYYPYQLEIRTRPHNNPDDLIKEFITTLKLCDKVFGKYKIKIVPKSWLGGNYDEMFNGIHFHFRNGNRNHFETTMFNIYPFILTLTDCFKFSPYDSNRLTQRFNSSQHCSFPNLVNPARSGRYSDVAMNRHTENSRHRLKTTQTMEIRTFDVSYNIEYFKSLVTLMFNVVKYIKTDKRVYQFEHQETENKLYKTREEISCQRIGFNYLFDDYNNNIYRFLCEKFKAKEIKVPFSIEIGYSDRTLSNERTTVSKWLLEKGKDIENNKKEKKKENPYPRILEGMNTIGNEDQNRIFGEIYEDGGDE